MTTSDFNFLEYVNSIENRMKAWYLYSGETFKNATNLGSSREHFLSQILSEFLPKTVVVGRGEIIDGKQRSGQQDIIIYRSEFPVLSGCNSINTYMIEGVIATIEVKSDLSTGNPNGLVSAMKNSMTVLNLTSQALKMRGSNAEFDRLKHVRTVKTFIIGYKGWKTAESFVENYTIAANSIAWRALPSIVYQPDGIIVSDSELVKFYRKDGSPAKVDLAYCSKNAFAFLFQSLLRAILIGTGGLIANAPGVNATMQYPLNNYFSLPETAVFELYPGSA